MPRDGHHLDRKFLGWSKREAQAIRRRERKKVRLVRTPTRPAAPSPAGDPQSAQNSR
jgi:hypothetical protein